MPPVAMTMVMPSATSISGAPKRTMSISEPYRWPSFIEILKKFSAKIDEDMAVSNKIGANGTPAFRINGVTVSGAQPFDKFKEVIDAQLAEAQKLTASGTRPSDVYVTLTNKNQAAGPDKPAAAAAAKPDAEEEDKGVWKVPVLEDDPVRGPKDALVTLVVFSDFQCPFCKRVEDTLKQVATTYGNDVRMVWKDNPLPFHPRAKPAAALARYAYKQKGDKGFWDAHDAIFASNPKLEDEDLKGIAEKLGVNWDDVKLMPAVHDQIGNQVTDELAVIEDFMAFLLVTGDALLAQFDDEGAFI